MNKHISVDIRVPIEKDNPALRRIESLCISCGQCKEVCEKQISVGNHYDLLKTGDTAICIHCGQCIQVCPTNSLVEKQDWMRVRDVVQSGKKKVIGITSPSVRVGLGEEFGLEAGSYVENQMVASIRALGVDYVFDTTFAADLTIMEEASELIERVKKQEHLPQFTSCCPAWVKFVETYYPELIPNISTSKSPISMFAPTIKTWFAKREGIAPEDIYIVAFTPCTAKKFEITRDEFIDAANYHHETGYQDCDAVVTTKELANWLRAENLDLDSVGESSYDELMPRGSGAGVIFGNTGGVMEAAIRSAYYFLTGNQPTKEFLTLEAVRGLDGVRSAQVCIDNLTLKVAVIHGTDHVRQFLHHVKTTNEHYDFVEVMTCPGGCIGGGGQPKHIGKDMKEIRSKRIASLYEKDGSLETRNSHDNVNIKRVYEEFYGQPLSALAHELLHTTYHRRDDLGEDPSIYETMYQQEQEEVTVTGVSYRCTVCGYIYEGDITLESEDYKCPLCGVPKELFELVEVQESQEKKEEVLSVSYRCTVCGYIYEGDITQESEDYKCPLCGVPKELFELVK